jgi:hypothetical protein
VCANGTLDDGPDLGLVERSRHPLIEPVPTTLRRAGHVALEDVHQRGNELVALGVLLVDAQPLLHGSLRSLLALLLPLARPRMLDLSPLL